MSMIFILVEIKFDIDINNDELLIIIWEPSNFTCAMCCYTLLTMIFTSI